MSGEYSDAELEDILTKVDGWLAEFAQSPHFSRLEPPQQAETHAVISFFTEYTYSYTGLTPKEWDAEAVRECCTDILPRKVTGERVFFESVAPVLAAFFTFLAEQSLLPQGHELARTVTELSREIIDASEAEENWGIAKTMGMAALKAGVDMNDPEALNRFFADYSARVARLIESAGRLPASLPQTPALTAPAPVHRAGPKVGRNDPCPCGSGKKFKKCCGA